MSRFSSSGEFEIDLVRYSWSVRHYAGTSTPYENMRGTSVSISPDVKPARDLIIDFPVSDYWFTKPKSTTAFELRLPTCIKSALNLGCKPNSKGKPFRLSSDGSV
jgi:hypothetical protein